MGKSVWLVVALVLLGILAFLVWQRAGEPSADADVPSAAAPSPEPQRSAHVDQALMSEPAPQPIAREPAGSNPDESGEVDSRWQAAVGLPDSVRQELEGSTDPDLRAILQRNQQLANRISEDGWGPDMQQRLNEFLETTAEERGENERLLITVACGDQQCQIQAVDAAPSASGSTPLSETLFDEIEQHWWFRDRLARAEDLVTTVNGRRYHVQYFDRKP